MFTPIQNELHVHSFIVDDGARQRRLFLVSHCLDLSTARSTIPAVENDLSALRLDHVEVKIDEKEGKLSVVVEFTLPWFYREKRLESIIRGVFEIYHRHLHAHRKVLVDHQLGEFVWGEHSHWETTICLDGQVVPLRIRDWGMWEPAKTLELARDLINNWPTWKERIIAEQTGKLLPLYNRTWREAEHPELDTEAFLSRLTLNSLVCDDSGWRSVHYDQDGLFTDHFVGMRISPQGKVVGVLEG